jgi:hypothetical protein
MTSKLTSKIRFAIIEEIQRILSNAKSRLTAREIYSQLSPENQAVLSKKYVCKPKGFSPGACIGRMVNELEEVERTDAHDTHYYKIIKLPKKPSD